ncbi:MAG: type II toxin-antitoxin system prevent-host-death family antitoxin [Actinomycetota bacterium]|nr:type II toxin-antitoxin system prevent-host-death family antitoxin [Actinomycetota bacterium]
MERKVPVRELNQHTSAVLAEVANGVAVTITKGGKELARLVPVTAGSPTLDRMVKEGRAQAATVTGPIPMPPANGDETLDVGQRLVQARDEERC